MTSHAALLRSLNFAPWLCGGEGCVRGFANRLVHPSLHLGESSADRNRARDVGGVEAVDLDPRVDQDQVTGKHCAVVARPVQVAGMRTGCGDRVVAHGVAVAPRAAVEDAFDDALAARVLDDGGKVGDDVVEAVGGDIHGELELSLLVVVLDQAQFRDELGELVIHTDHEVVLARDEVVDVRGRDPEVSSDSAEGGTRSDPELADRGIRIELARRAICALAEVQRDVVSRVGRVEHEHRIGLGIRCPPGQMREGGVRAEGVVGVVAALLEPAGFDHEALARERRRYRCATGGRERRLLARGGHRFGSLRPTGRNAIEKSLAERLASIGARGGRCGLLLCRDRVAVSCGAHTSILPRATECRQAPTGRSAVGGRFPIRPSTEARANRWASMRSRP